MLIEHFGWRRLTANAGNSPWDRGPIPHVRTSRSVFLLKIDLKESERIVVGRTQGIKCFPSWGKAAMINTSFMNLKKSSGKSSGENPCDNADVSNSCWKISSVLSCLWTPDGILVSLSSKWSTASAKEMLINSDSLSNNGCGCKNTTLGKSQGK